jgi:hypothetical protein
MVQCFVRAGLPAGLVTMITGRGSEIGDYLTTHPGVNCISFTGGDTGLSIAKKAGMVPMQMELGGKDACIVCDDADIDLAAAHIIKVPPLPKLTHAQSDMHENNTQITHAHTPHATLRRAHARTHTYTDSQRHMHGRNTHTHIHTHYMQNSYEYKPRRARTHIRAHARAHTCTERRVPALADALEHRQMHAGLFWVCICCAHL